ncbi:MAG TPA: DnaJ domain-containing protein [Tepidisphaeraceae bacterium]|nr:DnaJ domain-containing protein [Tepidisphaeraceae bacterium]
MVANCYFVLGVPPDATLSQIKRAYRKLANKYDPAHAGEHSHERFMQIKDAYETLSNSARRNDHNRELMNAPVEPDFVESFFEPATDLLNAFERYSPSRHDLRDTIEQNFTRDHLPKSKVVRELTVEALLTPEEAAHGGSVPIDFPVADVCTICKGTGTTGHFLCDSCGGQGIDWHSQRIDVIIPAHTDDGTSIPVSLKHLGVTNLYLTVLVRVAAPTHT